MQISKYLMKQFEFSYFRAKKLFVMALFVHTIAFSVQVLFYPKFLLYLEHIPVAKFFAVSFLESLVYVGIVVVISNIVKKLHLTIYIDLGSNLLKVTNFLVSMKTQKEIFEPLVTDWQREYFEALFKKEIWKARWINTRYTYAFLAAMWQKSPIGDLIEFVSKIAK